MVHKMMVKVTMKCFDVSSTSVAHSLLPIAEILENIFCVILEVKIYLGKLLIYKPQGIYNRHIP